MIWKLKTTKPIADCSKLQEILRREGLTVGSLFPKRIDEAWFTCTLPEMSEAVQKEIYTLDEVWEMIPDTQDDRPI